MIMKPKEMTWERYFKINEMIHDKNKFIQDCKMYHYKDSEKWIENTKSEIINLQNQLT